MCIIISAPADTHVKMRWLKNSWEVNDDGAGFMFVHNSKVIIKKGFMTFKDFAEAWKAVPESLPRVAHFRIRTHGLTDPDNTHPFEIFPGELALAHNGILPIDPPKDSTLSDTAAFVEFVLKKLPRGWHRSPAMLHLIDQYCGFSNKLAILDKTGKVTLVNEDKGTWEEGVWFSNLSFRTGGVRYARTVSYPGWQRDPDDYEYGEYGANYKHEYPLIPGPTTGTQDPPAGAANRTIESAAGEDDAVVVAAAIESELRGKAAAAHAAGQQLEADKLNSAADALLDERISAIRRQLRTAFGRRGTDYDPKECDALREELANAHRAKREATTLQGRPGAVRPTLSIHPKDSAKIGFNLGATGQCNGGLHA